LDKSFYYFLYGGFVLFFGALLLVTSQNVKHDLAAAQKAPDSQITDNVPQKELIK
jgi:hypothetical protein